jgi:uncharacterized membrane protein YgcG
MPRTKYDKSCPHCRDKEQHTAAEPSLLADIDPSPNIEISNSWTSDSSDTGTSSYDGGGGDYSGGGASDSWSSD